MKKIIFPLLMVLSCQFGVLTVSGAEILPESAKKLYPAPRFLPPAGHPRVLARPEDLETMRKNFKAPENSVSARMLKRSADALKSGKLDPKLNRHRYGVYDERIINGIQAKAYLYLLFGKIEDGQAAIKALNEYLDTMDLNMKGDVTRARGEVIFTIALVYDWCYPLLNSAQKKFYIRRGEEIAKDMEIGCPPVKQKGNITGHAGEAQLLRDLLSYGIAIYDEKPTMYLICAGRFFALMEEPRNFFYPSGRHHQGCMYGSYRFQWDLFAGHLFRRMGIDKIYSPAIKEMKKEIFYSRLPDGSFIPDGDHFLPRGRFMSFPESLLLFYSYLDDPELKAEFYNQRGSIYARTSPFNFLIFNNPNLKAVPAKELPLSCIYSDPIGGLTARSSWGMGKNADAAVVYMQGGGRRFGNHQHADAGSFQIYYKGLLAADPGQYLGYGTPYDWGFTKGSISHNLMLIYDKDEKVNRLAGNDGGQRRAGDLIEPENMKILLGEKFDYGSTPFAAFGPNKIYPLYNYLECDIAPAYSGKAKFYRRSMVYLNDNFANAKGMLLVFDRVTSAKKEFSKHWIMHSFMKPVWNTERKRFEVENTIDNCSGRLEVIPLLPEKFKTTVSPSVEFFGRKLPPPIPNAPNGKSSRLEILPDAPAERDVFLVALPFGDAGKSLEVTPEYRREGDFYAVTAGDWKVFFPAEDKVSSGKFTITADKANQKILLTSLNGTFTVSGLGFTTLPEKSGALFFVAPKAGKYEIIPGTKTGSPLPSYQ